ncbi:hypothetical protein DENSPDRAFT_884893 [Dentipellis sp. KUC8613]|nr:hypothetical protein DENSPDRAFT_884893 [Dentipellis sp. KUC8613]
MDKLRSLLSFNLNLPLTFPHRDEHKHPIAIVQYQRASFGVGTEEHLHWALFVLTDRRRQRGPSFQAIDRLYSDGRGVVWRLHECAHDAVRASPRCLGGVVVGAVRAREVDELREMLRANRPHPKGPGWNCRSWIMECLRSMRGKGWLCGDIAQQAALLPALRIASRGSSCSGRGRKRRPRPVLVRLEV